MYQPQYCVFWIKCASHAYCTWRERWQTVENVGGQLVSTGAAMCLHLLQYLQHMSGSVNMAQCPHTFPLCVCWPGKWENERLGWHLHVSVCSLMTQRSFLSHTFSLPTFMRFVFVWTLCVCISCAAHPPQDVAQSCFALADSSTCQFCLLYCQGIRV